MFFCENILNRFNEWIALNFDLSNNKIKEKIIHTNSVLNITSTIAIEANFKSEDLFVAQAIAILHDCARFPQIKKFNTFKDTAEFNHAFEGAKLLQSGLLKEMLPETRKYDEIIITAVKLHSSLVLPVLDPTTKMHCDLIRDADRTDLYNMCITHFDILFWNDIGTPNISPVVKKLFDNRQPIPFTELRNQLDFLALRLGLINQYNFKPALDFLKRENYVNRLVDLFLQNRPYYNKNDVEHIRSQALSFLEQ